MPPRQARGQPLHPFYPPPSLNTVEVGFALGWSGPAGLVRIRLDTITGPLLGTSDLTLIPPVPGSTDAPWWVGAARFHFATAVALQPSQRYVIEIVPVGGWIWPYSVYSDGADSYPNGRIIVNGTPDETPLVGGHRGSL
jgi:hypothetical protein